MGLFNFGIRKDIKEKLEKTKPLLFVSIPHIIGLPIAEKSLVQIYCYENKMEIDSNGTTFILEKSQIKSIDIKTDVEIQKQFVSSTGGAIAGAMIFGVVGALIGGRPKEKTSRNVSINLIITYTSDNNEIKHIGFDITHTPKSRDIVKLYPNELLDKTIKL